MLLLKTISIFLILNNIIQATLSLPLNETNHQNPNDNSNIDASQFSYIYEDESDSREFQHSLPLEANVKSEVLYNETYHQHPTDYSNIDAAKSLHLYEDLSDFDRFMVDDSDQSENDAKTDNYPDDLYDVVTVGTPANYISQSYTNSMNNVLQNLEEYELGDDVQDDEVNNNKLTEQVQERLHNELKDASYAVASVLEANKQLIKLVKQSPNRQTSEIKTRLETILSQENPFKINKELTALVSELYINQLTHESLYNENLAETTQMLLEITELISKHHNIDLSPRVDDILTLKTPVDINKKLIELVAEVFYNRQFADDTISYKNLEESKQILLRLIQQISKQRLIDVSPRLNSILSSENPTEICKKLIEILAEFADDSYYYKYLIESNNKLAEGIMELSKYQFIDRKPMLDEILAYENPLDTNKLLLNLVTQVATDIKHKSVPHRGLEEANNKLAQLAEEFSTHQRIDIHPQINGILSSENPIEINMKLSKLVAELSARQLQINCFSNKNLKGSIKNLTYLADLEPLVYSHLTQTNLKFVEIIEKLAKQRSLDLKSRVHDILSYKQPDEINNKLMDLLEEFSKYLKELYHSNQNLLAGLYHMLFNLPNHRETYKYKISNILTERDPKVVNTRLLKIKSKLLTLLQNDKSTTDDDSYEENPVDDNSISHEVLALKNIKEHNERLLALIRERSELQQYDVGSKIDAILSYTDAFEINKNLLDLLSELPKQHLTGVKPTSNESLSLKKLVEANDRLRGLVQELSEHQTTDALTRMENIFSHNDPFDIYVKLVELVAELSKHQGTVTKPTTDDSSSNVEHGLDYITVQVNPSKTNGHLLKPLEELTDARPATDESLTYEKMNKINRKLVTTVAEFLTHEFIGLESRVNDILSNKNPHEVNKRLTDLVEELIRNEEYDAEPLADNPYAVPTLVESNQQLIRLVRQSPKHQTSEIKTRLETILSQENPFESNKELTALVSELYINQVTNEPFYNKNLAETNQLLLEIIELISKHQNIDLSPRVDDILTLKTPVDINKKLIELVAEVYNQQFADDTFSYKNLEESKQILLRSIQQISKQRLIDVSPRLNSILSSENPTEISKKLIEILAEFADDSYYYKYIIESNTKLAEGIMELSKYQFIDRKPMLDDLLAYENPLDTNKLLLNLVAQVATDIKHNSVPHRGLEEANNKLAQLAEEFSTHQRIDIHPQINGILSSENPIEINMKLSKLVAELSARQLQINCISNKNLKNSFNSVTYLEDLEAFIYSYLTQANQKFVEIIEKLAKQRSLDLRPRVHDILSYKLPDEINNKFMELLEELSQNQLTNTNAIADEVNLLNQKLFAELYNMVYEHPKYKTTYITRIDEAFFAKDSQEANTRLLELKTNLLTLLENDNSTTDDDSYDEDPVEDNKHFRKFSKRAFETLGTSLTPNFDYILCNENSTELKSKLLDFLADLARDSLTNAGSVIDETFSLKNIQGANQNLINLLRELSKYQTTDVVPTLNHGLSHNDAAE